MKTVVKLIFLAFIITFSHASIIIQTKHGPVEGTTRISDLGREYFSFMGIPYAKPAEGALKFRDPEIPEPWVEPLNCTGEGSQFWNANGFQGRVVGSFDSLHVNVFTNDLDPSEPYPVMLYIHGGAYSLGSGSTELHGPDFLVEKNVTIVTFNYRLGVYGFLSLNDSSLNVPGNAGMKDQRLAMKWVQENIRNFGGDPSRVTLFGLSAGGGSVHYHMLSENSKGLFHRGISMGSHALQNIGRIFPSAEWAQLLSTRLGFTGDLSSDREILEFLENADPVSVVLETMILIPFEESLNGTVVPFGPTLEPFETEGAFITANVFDLIENAWSNEIPYIVGHTSMEVLTVIPELQRDRNLFELYKNFENFIPLELGIERNTEKAKKYAKMIKDVYYPVFEPTVTNIDGLAFLWSDNDLWFPTQLIARYRLRAGNKAPTYIYRFDAETDYDLIKQTDPALALYRYPSHGIDTMHLFKSILHKSFANVSNETRNMVELMTTSFTNFAATGDPSIFELDINWLPVSSENELLMGLNVNEVKSEVMVLPESRRMKVFAEIWDTERNENSPKAPQEQLFA